MEFKKNVKLAEYTTFKIGGPAKYFFVARNNEDLIEVVVFSKKEKLPFFVLGGGSNLLVSDKGFDGIVIKIMNTECRITNTEVRAGAGVNLGQIVNLAAAAGLSGLEWAAGIPGTLGGAVRGNAGAFDGEMKDAVEKVEVFDAENSELKTYDLKDCRFNYRTSIFKENPNLIILSCKLYLGKGDKEKIQEKINGYLDHRRQKHPKEPSAGSVFKNVGLTPTALLIHRCGLTGKQIGKAQISNKHSNFIINLGGAKAKDVLGLIDLAKKEVKNKLGIEIEEEVQFLS